MLEGWAIDGTIMQLHLQLKRAIIYGKEQALMLGGEALSQCCVC